MKTSTTLGMIVVAGIAAFFLGRMSPEQSSGKQTTATSAKFRAARDRSPSAATGESAPRTKATARIPEIPSEKTRLLTRKERMELIRTGALVWNSANQSAVLLGIISTLSEDELKEATGIIGGIQDRGNYQSQDVWDAIWNQWGRLDPVGCFADFADKNRSRGDYSNVMLGWLETNPSAALAWAKDEARLPQEAVAAALAITRDAGGDIQKLQSAIGELPPNSKTTTECLQTYFDLVRLEGKDRSTAAIYDELSPSLRAAAWPVAMQRLSYEDPQAATAWITAHANDPGQNYRAVHPLVSRMTMQDPESTANWAVKLPEPKQGGEPPLHVALMSWRNQDPEAMQAWVKAQAPGNPWIAKFQTPPTFQSIEGALLGEDPDDAK